MLLLQDAPNETIENVKGVSSEEKGGGGGGRRKDSRVPHTSAKLRRSASERIKPDHRDVDDDSLEEEHELAAKRFKTFQTKL